MKYLWSKTEHSRQVALTILVLLCIWEISVRALGVREFMLPAPSKIIVEFFQSPGYLLMQSLSTLETTVVGFVLAVVLGVVIAIGIVSFQFLDRTLYSLLVALNAVPKVALAPLFIILLGTGSAPKIAFAQFIWIFPLPLPPFW